MKNQKDVIADSNIPARLVRAVVRQLGGTDSMGDIARHGIDGGYGGFIYYSDTCAFYKRNRAEILKLAEDLADNMGGDMLTMISNFGCLKDAKLKPTEIMDGLNGRGEMADQIQNAMAWLAAEEVARAFDED